MSSPPFDLVDIVMRAGAGAGKTTELTDRVLKLAQAFRQDQKYPHFVVTTFTRKATQELKERLLKKAMATQDAGLVGFVQSPSHLHISTIHGVLSLFLAKYGSGMGLSPKLTMVSERKNQQSLKRLIRDFCAQDAQFNANFQSLLENAEFKDILSAFKATFQLQQQFSELRFSTPTDFENILALKVESLQKLLTRFVTEAASAQGKWLELKLSCEAAAQALRLPGSHIEFLQNFEASLPATRKAEGIPESWLDLRKEIKESLEEFSEQNVQLEYWQRHQELSQQFESCSQKINEKWLEEKLRSGEITMSDLEGLSLRLIRQFPDAAASFSKSWDYWLVDEYQDTSPAQVEILKALMGSRKSFVVGDPQQSIYLFRGARSEVFDEKEKLVESSGGILFPKMINYRSEPQLLLFFNHVFIKLGFQFRAMEPKAPPSPDKIPVTNIIVIPEQENKEIDFQHEAVLFRIQELLKDGVPAEKICVLGRSHKDLETMALQARELGIPVQLHTVGGLFDRRETLDALALMKFLCNPHDNANFLQLVRSPFFNIPDQTIYELCQKISGSYWMSFCQKLPDQPVLEILKTHLTRANRLGVGVVWSEQLIESGYFLYAQRMDPSGRREANLWKLMQMIQAEEKRPGFSYLEFLQNQDASGDTEEGDQSEAVPVIEPQRVHLMTIHASKGLEFHHIILPRMGNKSQFSKTRFFVSDDNVGLWSISLPDPENGKMEASLAGRAMIDTLVEREKREEDRKLYVALTRAEKGVTLIFNEKVEKDSWAARLPLDLSEGLHEETHFSYRVRREALRPEARIKNIPQVSGWKEKFTVSEDQKQSWKMKSVTEILEKTSSLPTAEPAKREMSDIQKALTGVAVHRLFENLKYQWLRDPDFDWKTLLKELPERSQKALIYLMEDQNGLWAEIIKNGEVEFGFSARHGKSLVQGQIDLWGRDSKGQVWLVDYKTGSPLHSEKAFQQLEIYAWALYKMKKLNPQERIQLSVIYPFSEKTLVKFGQLRIHETEELIQE